MKAHLRLGTFLAGGAMMLAGCSSTSVVGAPTSVSEKTTTYVLSKDFCDKMPFESWKDQLGKLDPDMGLGRGKVEGRVAECDVTVERFQTWITVNVNLLRRDPESTGAALQPDGETTLRDSAALAELVEKARPQSGNKRCGISLVVETRRLR